MAWTYWVSLAATIFTGVFSFRCGSPLWITALTFLIVMILVAIDEVITKVNERLVIVVLSCFLVSMHLSAILGSYTAMIMVLSFWIGMAREWWQDRKFSGQQHMGDYDLYNDYYDHHWTDRFYADDRSVYPSQEKVDWKKEGF